jgi:hypothetical protein
MFKDFKTTQDRPKCHCPECDAPRADWKAVLIALTVGLVLAWFIVDKVIGADKVIEVAASWF